MRLKREELNEVIIKDAEEKQQVENKIEVLNGELKCLMERLEKKENLKKEYDRIIKMSEDAYEKILDSSQTLLSLVKREAVTLKQSTDSAKQTSLIE